ncbi:type 4a pilus biogenesis protein PilO [Peptococcaceae bacterium 1198_IL3148]
MNRFTTREKSLLAILGGLILLTLLYYLLVPQINEYRRLCDDIEQTIKRCDQLTKINEELIVEQNKLFASRYQLQNLQRSFNMELIDGGLYVKLAEGANNHRVTIKEIVAQKVIDCDIYLQLPITIGVSGDFSDILAYIQWLENINELANFSEITQFTIEPDQNIVESGGRVNTRLTLSLYSNVNPEVRMQIETNGPVGRSNGFVPATEYHYLHNNQQNGGQ